MKGTNGLFRLGMVALALTFMVLAGCKTDSDDSGSGTKGDGQQDDTTMNVSITIRNDTSGTEAAAITGVKVNDINVSMSTYILGSSESYDTTKTAAAGATMSAFTITPKKSGNRHWCHIYVSVEGSTEVPWTELKDTSSAYTLKLSSNGPNNFPRYTLRKE